MRTAPYRLAEGGRVDRERPLGFRFNGRAYEGLHGDTLASALIANGVHLVGRSFKYHRPRGIMAAGEEEANALVRLGEGDRGEPNLKATQVELHDGLVAASQNCWPSVGFDLAALSGLFERLIPAGFYYKTFMRPKALWRAYEAAIRHMAGLGRAPGGSDPDRYDHRYAHCDVAVVGAGPAGLAAAQAAARGGARVVLADEQAELGGSLLCEPAKGGARIAGKPAEAWRAATVAALAAMGEVTLLTRATVFGYYDHNLLCILERVSDHLGAAPAGVPRQRLWHLRARQVVLATGAIERPLVFRDNDRPGIMLASAARAYVNRYAARPGERAVVATNNDGAYRAALDLAAAGVGVSAVIDARPEPDGELTGQVRELGIELLPGWGITGVEGRRRVRAVEVQQLTDDGRGTLGERRRIACDLVCMSGGWTPTVHLFSQSRGRLGYDDRRAVFLPEHSVQAERSAGACNGAFTLEECLAEGVRAGAEAARAAGFGHGRTPRPPTVHEPEEAAPGRLWVVPWDGAGERGGRHFVDFQYDVTAADVRLAAREGYRSVEHMKRYTTTGMATDQGKTSNPSAFAVLAEATGVEPGGVGTTTFRPPYTPVPFAAMAGRDVGPMYDPIRTTPMHRWHERMGAVFEDVGQWKRPFCYPRPGEGEAAAVDREVLAARRSIGVLDASTLGKIDLKGPDAGRFLDMIYTNSFSNLRPGRCRYGLMLGEDGMVFDDGVSTRLAEDHYHMTTTTGGAARVLGWLEMWLQTEWPELEVYCTSVTDEWAVVAIAGPNARRLLAELTDDIDLATEAFPFMSLRLGHVAGIPARVFRISFTGEVSFEVNVPADYGLALWQAVMAIGERFDITPYGTEAMHVLRAEKGYIIAGQDTDGTVTPYDLGMDWIVGKNKADFLGKRSLGRSDTARAGRKEFVGLETQDPAEVLPEGGQIVAEVKARPPMQMLGHVTSSYMSPNLGHSIALAMVQGGHGRLGETLYVPLEDGRVVPVTVTRPQFFDPEGTRLHG
ncbi:MAG: sarcosine oxidase subunit alpha family protein [Kiloniellales bacterium]